MAAAKSSEPRERLLRTASEIFYRDGIHSVGVDRIVAEAGVTRATFYRHFPSKEDLVVAYLEDEHHRLQAQYEPIQHLEASQKLEAAILGIAEDITRNHTRGCPFINAAAEYPDENSRVRGAVKVHREWFRGVLEQVLTAVGRENPRDHAGALVLLRDAALVGGYLDGPERMRQVFIDTARAVAGLN